VPYFCFKAKKCLFKQMMSMRQPEDFVTFGQWSITKEVGSRKSFATTRRKNKDTASVRHMFILEPGMEFIQRLFLMRDRISR
jgi:hypothetical protein